MYFLICLDTSIDTTSMTNYHFRRVASLVSASGYIKQDESRTVLTNDNGLFDRIDRTEIEQGNLFDSNVEWPCKV
jgi:hypothetical protein